MNDSGHGYQPDADPGADAEKNGTSGQGPAIGESPAADKQSGTPVQAQNAEPSQPQPAQARPRRRRRSLLREFPILVVVALLLAVAIKTFALQAFFIPSASMENTLEINDRILVNKMVYDVRGIHRGDIVVFNGDGSWDSGPEPVSQNVIAEYVGNFESMFGFGHPGEIYVKRVIGLPGDHVACCNAQGQITVNGVPLAESSYLYPGDAPSTMRFNIVVPAGRLWVMGDHRSVSDDSRGHVGDPGGGTISENAVLGRAFVIIWPISRWRFLPIPATFEQAAFSKVAAGPGLPLTLGFAGAVPLTLAARRFRPRRGREIR
jgi:signal peptidase I